MSSMPRRTSLRVLVLNGWVGYAPFEKRIRALRGECSSLHVLGVSRNLELGEQVTEPFEALGEIEAGHYLRRVPVMFGSIRRVRSAAHEADIVYALGFEMGALAVAATRGMETRPAIVYEIHDIRNAVLGGAPLARVLRALERAVVRRTKLLVVTSESYLSKYYFPMLGIGRTASLVIENKLIASEVPERSRVPALRVGRREGDPIVIGYFGSIRCGVAWRMIKEWVQRSEGRVQCIVRGSPRGVPGFYEDVSRVDGLSFGGPYRDPEDLADLYGKVDLVWAAGNQTKVSSPWSRVCRFYNACHFKRPLIVAEGTDDARAVASHGIGLAIDLERPEVASSQLDAITEADLGVWAQALEALPDSTCTYVEEHREVFDLALRETVL